MVGGFNHLEKYESQWEGLSHILWKIKFMFETHQPDNLIYIYIVIYNYSEWGVRINWGASPCRFCLLIRVVRIAAQCFLMPSPGVFKA